MQTVATNAAAGHTARVQIHVLGKPDGTLDQQRSAIALSKKLLKLLSCQRRSWRRGATALLLELHLNEEQLGVDFAFLQEIAPG